MDKDLKYVGCAVIFSDKIQEVYATAKQAMSSKKYNGQNAGIVNFEGKIEKIS